VSQNRFLGIQLPGSTPAEVVAQSAPGCLQGLCQNQKCSCLVLHSRRKTWIRGQANDEGQDTQYYCEDSSSIRGSKLMFCHSARLLPSQGVTRGSEHPLPAVRRHGCAEASHSCAASNQSCCRHNSDHGRLGGPIEGLGMELGRNCGHSIRSSDRLYIRHQTCH
jgi:hypothetical protein